MTASSRGRLALTGLVSLAMLAAVPAQAASQIRTPKWELDINASLAVPIDAVNGLDRRPPAGPAFVLGDGSTPTRAVHSWFFGAGADLLNQVLSLRGVPQRMTPLDRRSWPIASHRPSPQAGFRLARQLTGVIWLEFTAELAMNPLGFDGDARNRIEESRASFVSAFTALKDSSTVLADATVTSTAHLASGGHRLMTAGTVQFRAAGTGLRPYLLAGAGFAVPLGRPASVELTGHYELRTPGGTILDETDTLILSYRASRSFFTVAGFGFVRDLSTRSGWRVEARVSFGRTSLDGELTTRPVIEATSPAGAAILNATSPGLQFANNGLRTNLSALPLAAFPAVEASGRVTRWLATAGYFWRF